MSIELKGIKDKLALVSNNVTMLDMLIEFERMLDNANLYSYQNWFNGELVEGPNVERYWVTCKFMFPLKLMPDTMGGMRLTKFGCKVKFEKDTFLSPVKITSKASYDNSHTKKAKIKKHPVWIVTIQMPRRFIDERLIDDILATTPEVDTDDISAAYDAGTEDVMDVDTGESDMGDDLGGDLGGDMGEEL